MNENKVLDSNARFAYLDNIRSFVIILVVFVHSMITYSGMAKWYYTEATAANLNLVESTIFSFLVLFNQAWFMGILFFLSAVLAAKSLKKRNPWKFVKERLFRLGIPLLLYIFIIEPFINFIILKRNDAYSLAYNYTHYIISFEWIGGTGPLWFVEILLLFCIIYAVIKYFFQGSKDSVNPPKIKHILWLVPVVAIFAFIIRLWFPIGTIFLNLQLCFFSSYIVLFIFGIIVGENQLLESITGENKIKWFNISLIASIPAWLLIMILSGAHEGKKLFVGGLYWQSFAYAMWEAFIAIAFSIGLMAFFKKYINISNKFTRTVSDNAFGIYVFHAPWLVIISLVLKERPIEPLLKTIIVMVITFPVCLIFSSLVRLIKPFKKLLK
jgi:surface polysaccharide O-acyltransferase-like enzyme